MLEKRTWWRVDHNKESRSWLHGGLECLVNPLVFMAPPSSCTTKCSTWPPAPLPHPLCKYSWSFPVDPSHVCWEETRATVEGGVDQPFSTVHKVSQVLQAEVPHLTTPSLLLSVLSSCPPQDDGVCLCSIVISKVCRTLPHAQYEPHLQKYLSYSNAVISWFLVPFAHCNLSHNYSNSNGGFLTCHQNLREA